MGDSDLSSVDAHANRRGVITARLARRASPVQHALLDCGCDAARRLLRQIGGMTDCVIERQKWL
jgi:hypothetical protein